MLWPSSLEYFSNIGWVLYPLYLFSLYQSIVWNLYIWDHATDIRCVILQVVKFFGNVNCSWVWEGRVPPWDIYTYIILVCHTNLPKRLSIHRSLLDQPVSFSLYRTPLHVAVSKDNMFTVQYLTEDGADISIKDKRGVSMTMAQILVLLIEVCVIASFPVTIILYIHEGPLSCAPYKIR